MPELPEGTDRNRLVIVRPRNIAEGTPEDQIPEHVVGAAWLQSAQGTDDFEFLRFDGETPEQATAREDAAAAAAKAAQPAKTDAGTRRQPNFD